MKLSDIPSKFSIPFANAAGAGYIRAIPTAPTGVAGQASLQEGFPPANSSPVSAGGVPPFGQDFNGILNKSTSWNWWAGTGAFPPYDPAWQTIVGGYAKSSIVSSLVEDGLFWLSLADDNVTNPDTGGAGWYVFSRIITSNKDIYVSPTGSDSNNGLSPATALLTLQAAVNLAYSYGPISFTVTIHAADSLTYNSAIGPNRPGPSIAFIGNAGTPANVQINGGASNCVSISGPNTATITGFTVTNTGVSVPAILASGGATVTCAGNRSLSCGGSVFQAVQATMVCGSHTFAGDAKEAWVATAGANLSLNASAVYTFSTALTFSTATAQSSSGGSLQVSSSTPSFVNPGNVTGSRYFADLNGIINTLGGGANFFPGTIAGTTQTGGQYA